jgi:hypothetical protein
MLWKCVFSLETNRGVGVDLDPASGEYARLIDQTACMFFRDTPSRYEWTGTALVEFSGWAAEVAAALLKQQQNLMVDAIKGLESARNNRKIEHPQIAGAFFEPSSKIDKIIGRSDALANAVPLPTNGGCFDDIDENPVPMTVGQLKKLRNAIVDREELNYLNRKAHIAAMKLVSAPLTYDYSGGWA